MNTLSRITCFSLVLISIPIFSQNFNKLKMDSLMNRLEKYDRNMGTVSIFQDGEEVYNRSIGFANLENNKDADQNTIYRIGSISKTFTATLVMKMVEKDQLKLDQKLEEFYPQIPSANEITIEHLLRHQSGIFNITEDEAYLDFMTNPISKGALINKISSYELVFEAGTKTNYSNSNYILLTFILEDISGKSYATLIDEMIAAECGLDNTAYGLELAKVTDVAYSYDAANPWEVSPQTHLSIPQGAGGIVSTATELNQFLNCLFSGKLVSEATLDSMMVLKNRMGIGLFTAPFYDKTAYGHSGGIDGFVANAFYFPEEKTAVSLLLNGQRTPINDLMIGILSIYFGKEYELPEYKELVSLSEEELKQYEGVYSSSNFPLKITISAKKGALYAQATGQPEFAMEALGEHEFQYEAAKLKMKFAPEEGLLNFQQMGMKYEMKKE